MKRQTVVLAIMAAALAVMVSTGIRQSFGLFLQPISDALGGGREAFSLAIAVSNLIYGLPLVGIIADRTGSRRVLAAGGVLYCYWFGHAFACCNCCRPTIINWLDGRFGIKRHHLCGCFRGGWATRPRQSAQQHLRHHHRYRLLRYVYSSTLGTVPH